MAPPESKPPRMTPGLFVIRYGLPLLLVVLGVVFIVVGHGHYTTLANAESLESAIGVVLLLLALGIWLINWMMRLSIDSTGDREKEEAAREEYTRTGHWPDEKR